MAASPPVQEWAWTTSGRSLLHRCMSCALKSEMCGMSAFSGSGSAGPAVRYSMVTPVATFTRGLRSAALRRV